MPRARRPWKVTRHDAIEKLDDNLWTVNGDLPGLPSARRRMFIVRRSTGDLLFAGAAIPLEESALAEVLAWGRPAVLVVPHHWHMIDADAFAKRLGLAVHGPEACATKTARRTTMAGSVETISPIWRSPSRPVAGVTTGEPTLIVRSGGGARTSLLVADVIQNTPPDTLNWFFRLCGLGGGPKVTTPFRLFFLRDRAALRQQLERWSTLPNLCRLVPCHGRIRHGGRTRGPSIGSVHTLTTGGPPGRPTGSTPGFTGAGGGRSRQRNPSPPPRPRRNE